MGADKSAENTPKFICPNCLGVIQQLSGLEIVDSTTISSGVFNTGATGAIAPAILRKRLIAPAILHLPYAMIIFISAVYTLYIAIMIKSKLITSIPNLKY